MLKLIVRIDQFILNKVERFMHSLQKLTGKTCCYFLGMFDLLVCALVLWVLLLSAWQGAPKDDYGISWLIYYFAHHNPFFFFIWFALILLSGLGWRHIEEMAFERVSQGLANPQKVSPFSIFLRSLPILPEVFFWALLLLSGVNRQFLSLWQIFVFLALLMLALYIDACDPLPPCKGKISEWLDKLNYRLIPVNNEN